MKVIEGEIVRVPKSVERFCRVFANQIVWRVTVVTRCDRFVTGFLPTVELFVHYVAIGTGKRVIAHIGVTLRIDKREQTDADRGTDGNSDNHKLYDLHVHCSQIKQQYISNEVGVQPADREVNIWF